MDLPGVLRRIERRLKELDISADAASRKAGKRDAIRNMKRAVKDGRRGVNTDTIAALAPVLQTSVAALLGERPLSLGKRPSAGAQNDTGATVPLVGYVGAGAAAHYYAVAQGALDDVPAPDDSTPDTVAVEVRGESLGPLFDRWLVFYDRVQRPVTPDLIGKLCVVGLADERILIKKIRAGRKGRFRLLSTPPEPPIEDAEVEWAAPVKLMTPR